MQGYRDKGRCRLPGREVTRDDKGRCRLPGREVTRDKEIRVGGGGGGEVCHLIETRGGAGHC